MSNEELVELIRSGIDVQSNMGVLYQQNKALINKIVYPYSGIVELEDLMQEAYFGLASAVRSFDETQGYKFMTYAQYKILNSIIRYSHNNMNIKRIPSYKMEQMSKYHRFKRVYRDEFNENPSDEELMDNLKIDRKALINLEKQINEMNCVSLEIQLDSGKSLSEIVSDNYDLELEVAEKLLQDRLELDLWEAVNELADREREVVLEKYKGNRTLNSIAKEKAMSPQRIEQIEKRALHILSKKRDLQEIAFEYGYDSRSMFKYGVNKFKHTLTSSTEFIALKRLEIEDEMKRLDDVLISIVS